MHYVSMAFDILNRIERIWTAMPPRTVHQQDEGIRTSFAAEEKELREMHSRQRSLKAQITAFQGKWSRQR